ncbi:hypothetical protein PspLS_09715 [Pyricularia sp. CBS 133598]|nr:hypothetical protein PspLS_09715 [Pyricularia sp. CBS 133598]
MHFSVSLACLALLHQAVGVPVPILPPNGGIPTAASPTAGMNGPGMISDVPPIPSQGQIKSTKGLAPAPNANVMATAGKPNALPTLPKPDPLATAPNSNPLAKAPKPNALATAPKSNGMPTAQNPNRMGMNPGPIPGMGDDDYGDDGFDNYDLGPGDDDLMSDPAMGLPVGGSPGAKTPDYRNPQPTGPTGPTGPTRPTGATGTRPPAGLADPSKYKGQAAGAPGALM